MSLESRLRARIKFFTTRRFPNDREEVAAIVLREIADALEAERTEAEGLLEKMAAGNIPWPPEEWIS